MKALGLALLALVLVGLYIRRVPPLHEQFRALIPSPDCAPFLDELQLRRV